MFLASRLKVPLRLGYFSDRQITPNPTGDIPRFNGLTAGIGVALGSMLLDVAYVYEFGEYSVSAESIGESVTAVAHPLLAHHEPRLRVDDLPLQRPALKPPALALP